MPFATATLIAGIAAAASVAGTAVAYEGQQAAASAQKDQAQIKQNQLNLDAARQTRDIARRAIMTRSQALTNATNQGAEMGSGLQGGFAQISSQAGMAGQAVAQNQQLGTQMFAANQAYTDAETMAGTGNAISSVGSQLYQNRDMLGRVGSYITGRDSWF